MKLNYKFNDPELLKIALTHSSVAKDGKTKTYERLEFLGDNVINLIISEAIFKKYPELPEGRLSQIHSNLVKTETLAQIAKNINLGADINLDGGEEKNDGRNNKNILEDVFEAVAGAMFLDSEYETCKKILLPLWDGFLNDESFLLQRDAKSVLQEWAQKRGFPIPHYKLIKEEGPSHKRIFTVQLNIGEYETCIAADTSIKAANLAVATKFLENLNENER